ncbi:unnamed protein product [Lota lota]
MRPPTAEGEARADAEAHFVKTEARPERGERSLGNPTLGAAAALLIGRALGADREQLACAGCRCSVRGPPTPAQHPSPSTQRRTRSVRSGPTTAGEALHDKEILFSGRCRYAGETPRPVGLGSPPPAPGP